MNTVKPAALSAIALVLCCLLSWGLGAVETAGWAEPAARAEISGPQAAAESPAPGPGPAEQAAELNSRGGRSGPTEADNPAGAKDQEASTALEPEQSRAEDDVLPEPSQAAAKALPEDGTPVQVTQLVDIPGQGRSPAGSQLVDIPGQNNQAKPRPVGNQLVDIPGQGPREESPAAKDEPVDPNAPAVWPAGLRLFGTMEFKSPRMGLPQWERVIKKGSQDMSFLSSCQAGQANCPQAAVNWQKLAVNLKGKPLMEQMKEVNKFFNQWPYRLDMDIYRQSDYWAAPMEFVRNSGDCEDYSIIKYYALKKMGVPVENMRIVALKDTILNIGHAVLAVYDKGQIYILDNQAAVVLPHTRFKHYVPQYSVNENSRWAHVPTQARPKK